MESAAVVPESLARALRDARELAVLTGAGMSAESGVATFRDAMHGLWARFDPQQLATPEAWRADRASVWAWYEWRRAQVMRARPHAGHLALAALAARRRVHLVTQNVDDLHERAGSRVDAHLHGSLFEPRCDACGALGAFADAAPAADDPPARLEPPRCTHCATGRLRPGVVWFGEGLPPAAWVRAEQAVEAADLVLVVGTSNLVYPAAELPLRARRAGKFVAEINPASSPLSEVADVHWAAGAAASLPALVESCDS